MKTQKNNFGYFYRKTFQDIVKNNSILTTLILSVFLYSFFYPIAYKGQQATALPIIIVDEEQSIASRKIIQAVTQSPNVEIEAITTNFAEAEALIKAQHADGILLLPYNLSNSISRGENGGIGLYLSASNFLKTQKIGLGLASSLENALAVQAEKFQHISAYSPALSIHQIPLYNTLSGYGSYVFPAVAPLIVHQTLLLGVCMLVATYRQKRWQPSGAEFFALFSAISSIGILACFYLFGFTYWLNDYPHGGNFVGMLISVPIYVCCVISIALFLASFLDIPERAGHVIVFTSIPLFLLSGTAWAHSAMPTWLQWLGKVLPSTQGIQTFIQLNQMGVATNLVIPKLIYLLCCASIFLILSIYRLKVKL